MEMPRAFPPVEKFTFMHVCYLVKRKIEIWLLSFVSLS